MNTSPSFFCSADTVLPSSHRLAGKEGGLKKGGTKEKLWAFTKEPIKQPLLKTLAGAGKNSELSSLACNAFTDIL